MTDWLLRNPDAGDGDRQGDFWLDRLEAAGLDDIRACDLDDRSWLDSVTSDDRILVAGGDGSVNQAAKFCMETGATLAVLPSGTANDFFRNLGLPDDPDELCRVVAQGPTRKLDVADFGDGIFLNVAHIGLGALASQEERGGYKQRFGRFGYGLSLLSALFSKQGFRATIRSGEREISGRWLSIAVANGAFYGGGNPVPGARLDNGQLVIVGVRPASVLRLLRAFLSTKMMRRSPRADGTVVDWLSSWCEVTTPAEKPVTVDGDEAGVTPFHARCCPGRLEVVCGEISSAERPAPRKG
ncbi:lipid kinase, YegS/Rv2252/BmrU family [Marinobacter daqiaonensis]|uniref:Lipid kinase, YegS/Rv2252/BmrU family n=1 Tax=Marinobacter daqiaonensis TaxID=650891 RepID=A0A1I6HFS3_9GAMM|nr:diacylglycerol kinase family protein [Marinobacter daqiaonensis]SFR53289.1 lipid kinase, YegS/Rv2252/BmrU family [Marinobacter daqiaonensis]